MDTKDTAPKKAVNKNLLGVIIVSVALLLILLVAFYVKNNSKEGAVLKPTREVKTLKDSSKVKKVGKSQESVSEKKETSKKQNTDQEENKVVFNITGQNFKFLPNTLTVKKGSVVVINFKSTQGFHDFLIDELNVKTNRVNMGEETSVEFTADKLGRFEYYCSVGNHRALGMVGTLVVE